MGMVTHFTELTVWQKADTLAHEVFTRTEAFPRRYLFDLTSKCGDPSCRCPPTSSRGRLPLIPQSSCRASISLGAQLVTPSSFRFSLERELIPVSQYETLTAGYEEVRRMLNGLTSSLRNRR